MNFSILEIFRLSMSIRTILHDKRTRIYETDMFFGEKACPNCFKHAQRTFFSSARKVSGYGGGREPGFLKGIEAMRPLCGKQHGGNRKSQGAGTATMRVSRTWGKAPTFPLSFTRPASKARPSSRSDPCSLPRCAHTGRGKRSRRCRGSAWADPCRKGGSRPFRREPLR